MIIIEIIRTNKWATLLRNQNLPIIEIKQE